MVVMTVRSSLLCGLVLASLAIAAQAQAAASLVTLLSGERAIVGARVVALGDVPAALGLKPHIITVAACPKVSADAVQSMMKDLQAKKFMVVLDLNEPSAQVCAR
jgi:hypothetical protein